MRERDKMERDRMERDRIVGGSLECCLHTKSYKTGALVLRTLGRRQARLLAAREPTQAMSQRWPFGVEDLKEI